MDSREGHGLWLEERKRRAAKERRYQKEHERELAKMHPAARDRYSPDNEMGRARIKKLEEGLDRIASQFPRGYVLIPPQGSLSPEPVIPVEADEKDL